MKINKVLKILFAASMVLAISETPAWSANDSPNGIYGSIAGRVTNIRTGEGIIGVKVTARSGQLTYNATTIVNGRYAFTAIPSGVYSISFTKDVDYEFKPNPFSSINYTPEPVIVELIEGENVPNADLKTDKYGVKTPSIMMCGGKSCGYKVTVYDYDNPATATDPYCGTEACDSPEDYNKNSTSNLYRVIEKGFTYSTSTGKPEPYTYVTDYKYNKDNRVILIDGPEKNRKDVVEYVYDSFGQLKEEIQWVDDNNYLSTKYYDYYKGNPGKIVYPNGAVRTLGYTEINTKRYTGSLITRRTDSYGAFEDEKYNDKGNLVYKRYKNGVSIHIGYSNFIIESGQNNYRISSFSVKPKDSPSYPGPSIIVEKNGNDLIYNIYDENGNKVFFNKMSSLDRTDRYFNSEYPNKFKEFVRDSNDNIILIRDENGNVTKIDYDVQGKMLSANFCEKVGKCYLKRYEYDARNNLIMKTDENSTDYVYQYDDMNRTVKMINPDYGTVEYSYDSGINVISSKDGKGSADYSYDGIGRLTEIDYQYENATLFEYDNCENGKGYLCVVHDDSGTTMYSYDLEGRITNEKLILEGNEYNIGYSYETDGTLKEITYPSSNRIKYHYNDFGQTDGIKLIDKNSLEKDIITDVKYLPFNIVKSIKYGNGSTQEIQYNNNQQAFSIKTGEVQDLSYKYNPDGTISEIIDNIIKSADDILYDGKGQILSFENLATKLSRNYDNVGNVLNQEINGDMESFGYQYGTNRVVFQNADNINYDNAGNTVEDERNLYSYNQSGRMIVSKNKDNNTSTDYTYRFTAQRMRKSVAGNETKYFYDQSGNIIAELNNGNFIEYIHLNERPVAKIGDGNTYYILNDHLNTPNVMVDQNKNVVWKTSLSPYGDNKILKEDIKLNFRYPGQYYDEETGLSYNYFRYYNSQTGRYLSPDPLELKYFMNIYTYAGNNSLTRSDPYGLLPVPFYNLFKPVACFSSSTPVMSYWWARSRDSTKTYAPSWWVPEHYGHCMAHCTIKKICGQGLGDIMSWVYGYGRESFDYIISGFNSDNYDKKDIEANERGRTCSFLTKCQDRCKIYNN